MYRILAESLNAAVDDDSVQVVLFQGQADIFSAGNDLDDFMKNPPQSKEAPVWKFLFAISEFPKPLIAAVSGPAIGIGTTMLLHCDLVYASSSAKFSLPFVNLGLCPEAGSALLLPRLMGHQRASKLLLFGDTFNSSEARELGLVIEILSPEEVNAYALKEALRLSQKPQNSLMETKRLLKQSDSDRIRKQIEDEGAAFHKLLNGSDFKEAVLAFKEKREPNFKIHQS